MNIACDKFFPYNIVHEDKSGSTASDVYLLANTTLLWLGFILKVNILSQKVFGDLSLGMRVKCCYGNMVCVLL